MSLPPRSRSFYDVDEESSADHGIGAIEGNVEKPPPLVGNLAKLGFKSGKWKKRSFSLWDNHLCYKDQTIFLSTESQCINVDNKCIEDSTWTQCLAKGVRRRSLLNFAFAVLSTSTSTTRQGFLLAAKNNSEKDLWMETIQRACDRLRTQQPVALFASSSRRHTIVESSYASLGVVQLVPPQSRPPSLVGCLDTSYLETWKPTPQQQQQHHHHHHHHQQQQQQQQQQPHAPSKDRSDYWKRPTNELPKTWAASEPIAIVQQTPPTRAPPVYGETQQQQPSPSSPTSLKGKRSVSTHGSTSESRRSRYDQPIGTYSDVRRPSTHTVTSSSSSTHTITSPSPSTHTITSSSSVSSRSQDQLVQPTYTSTPSPPSTNTTNTTTNHNTNNTNTTNTRASNDAIIKSKLEKASRAASRIKFSRGGTRLAEGGAWQNTSTLKASAPPQLEKSSSISIQQTNPEYADPRVLNNNSNNKYPEPKYKVTTPKRSKTLNHHYVNDAADPNHHRCRATFTTSSSFKPTPTSSSTPPPTPTKDQRNNRGKRDRPVKTTMYLDDDDDDDVQEYETVVDGTNTDDNAYESIVDDGFGIVPTALVDNDMSNVNVNVNTTPLSSLSSGRQLSLQDTSYLDEDVDVDVDVGVDVNEDVDVNVDVSDMPPYMNLKAMIDNDNKKDANKKNGNTNTNTSNNNNNNNNNSSSNTNKNCIGSTTRTNPHKYVDFKPEVLKKTASTGLLVYDTTTNDDGNDDDNNQDQHEELDTYTQICKKKSAYKKLLVPDADDKPHVQKQNSSLLRKDAKTVKAHLVANTAPSKTKPQRVPSNAIATCGRPRQRQQQQHQKQQQQQQQQQHHHGSPAMRSLSATPPTSHSPSSHLSSSHSPSSHTPSSHSPSSHTNIGGHIRRQHSTAPDTIPPTRRRTTSKSNDNKNNNSNTNANTTTNNTHTQTNTNATTIPTANANTNANTTANTNANTNDNIKSHSTSTPPSTQGGVQRHAYINVKAPPTDVQDVTTDKQQITSRQRQPNSSPSPKHVKVYQNIAVTPSLEEGDDDYTMQGKPVVNVMFPQKQPPSLPTPQGNSQRGKEKMMMEGFHDVDEFEQVNPYQNVLDDDGMRPPRKGVTRQGVTDDDEGGTDDEDGDLDGERPLYTNVKHNDTASIGGHKRRNNGAPTNDSCGGDVGDDDAHNDPPLYENVSDADVDDDNDDDMCTTINTNTVATKSLKQKQKQGQRKHSGGGDPTTNDVYPRRTKPTRTPSTSTHNHNNNNNNNNSSSSSNSNNTTTTTNNNNNNNNSSSNSNTTTTTTNNNNNTTNNNSKKNNKNKNNNNDNTNVDDEMNGFEDVTSDESEGENTGHVHHHHHHHHNARITVEVQVQQTSAGYGLKFNEAPSEEGVFVAGYGSATVAQPKYNLKIGWRLISINKQIVQQLTLKEIKADVFTKLRGAITLTLQEPK